MLSNLHADTQRVLRMAHAQRAPWGIGSAVIFGLLEHAYALLIGPTYKALQAPGHPVLLPGVDVLGAPLEGAPAICDGKVLFSTAVKLYMMALTVEASLSLS